MRVGDALGASPLNNATTAAAHTLPCPLAMVADLGMAGAICSESPSTCTPFAAVDSYVVQSTLHQRLLAVMKGAAIAPAFIGGSTLSTSPFWSPNSSFTVFARQSTSTALLLGRYSMMPL